MIYLGSFLTLSISLLFCLFVWFDSLRPINNFSVKKERVFLGRTSTKLGLMFLLTDTTQWRRWGSNLWPLSLDSSTLPLSHCASLVYCYTATFWPHIVCDYLHINACFCLCNCFICKIRVHIKKIVFLFLNQNIRCGYSKEPSQWDGSFERPKHMLKLMGKKIFTILG